MLGTGNIPSGRGDVGNVRCGNGEPMFPLNPCDRSCVLNTIFGLSEELLPESASPR